MSSTRFIKCLGALILIGSLCGCEKSAYEHLANARQSLADIAYDDAIASADAGLQGSPDEATRWGLDLVMLEALARSGRGEETKAQLQKLIQTDANRLPASEYFATAHQLKSAGESAAAIEVLDMGKTFFQFDPVIARMIEQSSAGGDSAELEMLRSLGYIE
jgi:hypothetical protein